MSADPSPRLDNSADSGYVGETSQNPLAGSSSHNNNNNNNNNTGGAAAASSSSPTKKPKEFNWNSNACYEMFERADMDIYNETFGGLQGIADILKSDTEKGVHSSSLEKRYEQFGRNELDRKEPVTFWEMLVDALGDEIIQILLVAAIISILFGVLLPDPYTGEVERESGWIKGLALILSCTVVVLIGAINNYQKAKKFEELELAQSVKEVSVVRDGEIVGILSNEIVMGDLLQLVPGMELPCDGIYISGMNLKANESPITGEPDLIEKNHNHPFIISGTAVEEGNGAMLVVAIGMNSFQGRMKNMKATADQLGTNNKNDNKNGGDAGDEQQEQGQEMSTTAAVDGEKKDDDDKGSKKSGSGSDDDEEDEDQTPLQAHLAKLADRIGQVGLALAVFIMVALSIKEGILIATQDKPATAAAFLGYVIIAITLIAVAIPEGLPLAVTISLAYSMKAMMEDNCLVRILASCETMGAATAICSDKTGTLTTNQMTVVQGYLFDTEFLIDNYGVEPRNGDVVICDRDNFQKDMVPASCSELFCKSLSINSTATQQKNDEGELVWTGNKTEIGLLGICKHYGYDYQSFRRDLVDGENFYQFNFDSKTKRMTSLVKSSESNGLIAHVKGASEVIAARCSRYLSKSGEVRPLDDEQRDLINTVIDNMASQGNRTISFAYNVLAGQTEFPHEHPDLDDLIFLGVLGIQDPIRKEVPAAIKKCASAGLVIRMVTGDNATTARAIGKKCGLFNEKSDVCLEGKEFREMAKNNRAELLRILPRMRILARSSPMDKYILVSMLQDEKDGLGDVVGVTGDGTNDAPALNLADVGFAMATGTDIAKGSADMILIDDNFATVVTAIKWGRAVNDNIKKFIQYQLAINGAGVLLTVVGSLASGSSKEPLAPVQLLWLNLIMDSLAALALATELPEEACLEREPVYKAAPLITNRMWTFIIGHGTYQFTLVMLLLFLGHNWFDTIEHAPVCHAGLDKTFINGTFTNPHTQWCDDRCTFNGGRLNIDTWVCNQGAIHSTIIFNAFIFCQVFNVINARKIYGELNAFEGLWDRSKALLGVFAFVAGLQAIAVEFFGRFMSVTPLPWNLWLITIGLGFIEIFVGFFLRLLPITDFKPDAAAEKTLRERERLAMQEGKKDHHHHHHHHGDGSSSGGSALPIASRRSDSSLKRSNSIMKRRGSFNQSMKPTDETA